jgi:hypothetical protein
MYRGDHWHDVPVLTQRTAPGHAGHPEPVEKRQGELMDRLPEAVIAPESPADADVARVIEAIVRHNHDVDGYSKEYRKLVHDLLVGGYCVQRSATTAA